MQTLTGRKAILSKLRRLAARQFGVFSGDQAAALGVDQQTLRRMSSTGDIARVLPRTYRFEGAPRSDYQDLSLVCRWAGDSAALSHDTAAWLLGLIDRKPASIHITRPRTTKTPRSGIVVHRAKLDKRDVSAIHGLAVTTMPRTVIDMAAVCGEEVVDIALDAAIRKGMSRQRFLERVDDLAAPGRNGIGTIKKLVAERVTEQGLTESPFERLLVRALRNARLPLPVCQGHLGDGGFSARVDFVYPDQRLVIEADGYRWHNGRAAWERDRLRISELAARGWRVLLVTWLQLKYRVDEVLDRIRRALDFTVPAPPIA
jgi:predicted transcriptional regulator of viral defense system/G:T-mismatch repair DNA endonuclease (very short patch repair protein)